MDMLRQLPGKAHICAQHFSVPDCLTNMSDEKADSRRLIERIVAGDEQAFRELVENNQRLVTHIVFRMIDRVADREDLCQEVFMRVYRALPRFEHGSKLSTWIASITFNTCVNHMEKSRPALWGDLSDSDEQMDEFQASGPMPDEAAELDDISQRLKLEISALPPRYRAIITMFHLDDMTYLEIADATGLPEGTVKSHLFRARKLLKDRLLKKYRPEDLWPIVT